MIADVEQWDVADVDAVFVLEGAVVVVLVVCFVPVRLLSVFPAHVPVSLAVVVSVQIVLVGVNSVAGTFSVQFVVVAVGPILGAVSGSIVGEIVGAVKVAVADTGVVHLLPQS